MIPDASVPVVELSVNGLKNAEILNDVSQIGALTMTSFAFELS